MKTPPEQLTLEGILNDPRAPWVHQVMQFHERIERRRDAALAKLGLQFRHVGIAVCVNVSDYAKLVAVVQGYGARDEEDKRYPVAIGDGD
jgi:hypothetical protein